MLWSFNNTLSALVSVTPSIAAGAEDMLTFAVEATTTESLKSRPVLTASTYSLDTSEVAPKPALSL